MYPFAMLKLVRFWRCRETGNIYSIHAHATYEDCERDKIIVYCNSEWKMFYKNESEFLDGRFEPMNSTVLKSLKG